MSNRLDLYKSSLKDPRVKALLDTISYAEGTSGPEGYRTMFTGKKFDTSKGWKHPDTVMRGGGYASTAAGRYQMLTPTYQMAAKATGTSGFSPSEQDLQAVFLIDNRQALEPLLRGENINTVINQLAPEWASLPTSEGKSAYDQPVRGISELEKYYKSRLDGSGIPGATPAMDVASQQPVTPPPPVKQAPEKGKATVDTVLRDQYGISKEANKQENERKEALDFLRSRIATNKKDLFGSSEDRLGRQRIDLMSALINASQPPGFFE